jgi:hypothetical protein
MYFFDVSSRFRQRNNPEGVHMNEPHPQIQYLQTAMSRIIGSEETYVVMCRPISNGTYVLEYVARSDGKLLAVVPMDRPPPKAAE